MEQLKQEIRKNEKCRKILPISEAHTVEREMPKKGKICLP
jgi:hypothetical protein